MADTTKLNEVEVMRRQIEQQLGPVDVLVANAGGNYTKPGPLEDVDEEGWRLSIDGNLTATFLCLKELSPRHEGTPTRHHRDHFISRGA